MHNELAKHPVQFHISMNVSSIDKSVEFFSNVFATSPAKQRSDYAKFELTNPPLTLSLEPVSPSEHGALNHVGFKLKSAKELTDLQLRLETVGISSEREEGVECCYSRQSKFWVHDPDGVLWEMYILEGDIEHRGAGQSAESVLDGSQPATSPRIDAATESTQSGTAERTTWFHRLGSPLVIADDIPPASLDEVSLQGSLNAEGTSQRVPAFLKQIAGCLKPGGRISIHCLTADRHVDGVPQLTGPASVVKSVPCLQSLMDRLEDAGFEAVRLTKYGQRACFTFGDAELRETMVEAFTPQVASAEVLSVLYKGPFAELRIEGDVTLFRGRPTTLSREVVERLMSSPQRDAFVILEAATAPISCNA